MFRGPPRPTLFPSTTLSRALAAPRGGLSPSRAAPPPGPGLQWWQMDVLGYDQAFFGVLAQLGTGLAIAGSLLLGGRIVRWPLGAVLAWLAGLGAVLTPPPIGMLLGLPRWTQAALGVGIGKAAGRGRG